MYTLYYKPTCPFCQRVLAFAEENKIELTLLDVSEQENLDALVARGGKTMVPYLVDEEAGKEMYESMDIIEYMKAKM